MFKMECVNLQAFTSVLDLAFLPLKQVGAPPAVVAIVIFVGMKCLVVRVVTAWSSPQRVLRADHSVQQSGVELCPDRSSRPHLSGGHGE